MLEVRDLKVSYGAVEALHGVTVTVGRGQIVTIIGANGAGKSTLLRTICGVQRPAAGSIHLEGQDVTPYTSPQMIRRGVALVPEGRHVFPELTVQENLGLGAYYRRDHHVVRQDLEKVLDLFPILRERLTQAGGLLSGGQQQMLAVGRALMSRPRLLLLDEPSLGLAPQIITEIFSAIKKLCDERGLTVLLVEQNAQLALSVADYGYIMERGRIVLDDTPQKLLANDDVKEFYLGVQEIGRAHV